MKARLCVASLTATASLLASGCSGAEIAPNRPALQHSFDITVDHWKRLGVTGIGGLNLLTVVDGSVSCDDTNITNDDISPATYCSRQEGEDTIFISDHSYEAQEGYAKRGGISVEATAASIAGHEIGHAVIDQLIVSIDKEKKELLADCLAGVAIRATAPELGPEAAAFFETIGSDDHGTDEQRKDAFENGFNNDVVACDDMFTILLSRSTPTPLATN